MRILVVPLLLAACQQSPSKLDEVQRSAPPPSAEKAPSAVPALPANASLEDRVARLEAQLKKYEEPLDFLQKVYAQQKQQQQQQERDEPAPDAVFAVDIAQDIK